MSVNALNVEQVSLLCRHFCEAIDAGINENTAIRTLEQAVDATARYRSLGHSKPVKVHDIPDGRWSVAAKLALTANPKTKFGDYLRIEHGSPKRAFTRLVLALYRGKTLNLNSFHDLIDRHWKLAVITIEEDRRLARTAMFESPEQRWAAAGIKF